MAICVLLGNIAVLIGNFKQQTIRGGGALPRLSETDFVQGVFGTLN